MRRALACLLTLCLANLSLLEAAPTASPATASSQGDYDSYEHFSPEQLDNLLAPIALYPDPLLSQILIAATFVDDVDEAARWVRSYGANRPPVNNRIINRNIDTANPRYDRYRGREAGPGQNPPQPKPQTQPRPRVQPSPRPVPGQPTQPARPIPPPSTRPAPKPQPAPHVFNRNEGNFDPRVSSQRGQNSRQQATRPAPAPRQAPQPRPKANPKPHGGVKKP